MPLLERTCARCQKEFAVFPSAARRSPTKYCSRNCYLSARNQKVNLVCASCGREFNAFACEVARGRKYCGGDCYKSVQSFRVKPIAARLWAKVEKTSGCWNFKGAMTKGYGVIGTSTSGDQDYAHRVSWRLAFGEIPDRLFVCHHCDNPRCVRPDHLWLGTPADNNLDRKQKGRTITYLKKLREEKTLCH
jgi:hypothetical protein